MWAAAAVVTVALAAAACSDSGNGSSVPATIEVSEGVQSGIQVTGVGEVLGEPDTMTLTIGVRVTEPTVEEAMDAASAATGRWGNS